MGIWSPKMREVALHYPPISMSLDSFNFYDLLHWIHLSVVSYFPIWSWIVLLGGLIHAFFKKRSFHKFIVFSSLTLPSIAVMILPQTRDHMFPHANTFIIWLVSLIGIIWSFDHISKMLSSKYNYLCMLLLLSAHTFLSNGTDLDSGLSFFPSLKKQRIGSETSKDISLYLPTKLPLVFRSIKWSNAYNGMQLRLQTSKPVYALSRMDVCHSSNSFIGGKHQWHILNRNYSDC